MKEKTVPTLLITGFLGSGKTTFINWLLQNHSDKYISVLLNEFGDEKLESQFIKQKRGDVIELTNGCMCCLAKSDVPRAIRFILEKSPKTKHLFIESSGLSDPEPVRSILNDPSLSDFIHFDANICIVDALNFTKNLPQHPIILSQVGDADLVIISKVNLCKKEDIDKLTSSLSTIIPGVKLLQFTQTLPAEIFLDQTLKYSHPVQKNLLEKTHTSPNHELYNSFIYKTDKEVDISKLIEIIRNLPRQIIRVKGIVFVNKKSLKYKIQLVGSRLDVKTQKSSLKTGPKTIILFVGTKFDTKTLAQKLDYCIQTDSN